MKMNFDRYIQELLMVHDCVILPGLGGFIANYKPAEIHPEQGTIHPPSKQILFNTNLVHNDGLLFAHVSKQSGYGYKDVQSLAEAFIKRILRDVNKGIKYTIEDIGYFYQDREKRLQFSAESTSNFLIDSYGLSFVHYKEFESQIVSTRKTYRSVPVNHDPIAKQRRIRRIVLSAAAACVAAALIIVPIKTGYFLEAAMDISTSDTFKAADYREPVVKQEARSLPAIIDETPAPVTYHIIVGSFRDFGNARELRSTLVAKGYQARILAADNAFYRVSASQAEARGKANLVLADIRSQGYESAWMLSN